MAPNRWTDDHRVRRVLRKGERLFLGVSTADGPHVTAVAFDERGDRLWAVVPRTSVKVRAVRADDRVGGLVRAGRHEVLLGGTATVVDPTGVRGLSLGAALELPFAAAGYLARNDRDLRGVLRDDPSPALALTRVALRIDIDRVALMRDGRLLAAWGQWPKRSQLLDGTLAPRPPDLRGVPARATRRLRCDTETAALGWMGPGGPNVLPARWHAVGWAQVDATALELCGALPAGRASVTLEASRYRQDSKRGVLLIGAGRVRRADDVAMVAIESHRITWWRGAKAGTVRRGTP